jgi:hypothetical protein
VNTSAAAVRRCWSQGAPGRAAACSVVKVDRVRPLAQRGPVSSLGPSYRRVLGAPTVEVIPTIAALLNGMGNTRTTNSRRIAWPC